MLSSTAQFSSLHKGILHLDKPLFPDVAPSFLYELFDESLPDKPVSLEEIQKLLEEKLIPYNTHFSHPAIWD